MSGVPRATLQSHVLALALCACFALASAGCSLTTNNGNCDAQGGGNTVSCGQSGGASSSAALTEPPATASAIDGSSPAPATGTAPTSRSPLPQSAQYRTIGLGVLCTAPDIMNQMEDCQDGYTTQQVSSRMYAWDAVAPATTTMTTVLSFPRTTCRSIKLTFGFTNSYNDVSSGYHLTISVWIIQGSAATQQVTVTNDQIGTVATNLDGGPWGIDTLANLPQAGSWGLLMNGSAKCSSYNGE
jgi:hypothetical protein